MILQIVALANLLPVDDSVDELDSYMYQTVRFCLFFVSYGSIYVHGCELKLRLNKDWVLLVFM